MKVRLPHGLERAEVRRRLEERKGEIIDYFPDGMADLESRWKGEDHMDFVVAIAGQRIQGAVDIADDHVVIDVNLPMILSFLNGKVENSVRKEGTRLLA
ncbi:MAG: polyhydroxyalkanoic acid system family protein [Pseudomonadota bacterium]